MNYFTFEGKYLTFFLRYKLWNRFVFSHTQSNETWDATTKDDEWVIGPKTTAWPMEPRLEEKAKEPQIEENEANNEET